MANPFIAVASFVAFLISELTDWGVYTFTGKPLHQRILISSLVSTPIDSAVFLAMIGQFSILACATMFISKMLAAVIIYYYLRNRNVHLSV